MILSFSCAAISSSSFLTVVNIGDRNPSVVIAFFLNMSHPGKVGVVESDQVSILCGVGQSKVSLCSCRFWINIKLDRHRRICELYILNMYGVAPKHKCLAVALENIVG